LDRLGLDLPDSLLREILQDVFWIASASLPGVAPSHSKAWLSNNPNAFPDLWISALTNPGVQNNEALIGTSNGSPRASNGLTLIEHMIDIMLLSETNIDNPLIKSLETNRFAVKSLLQVPIAVFSRKERTRIREAWLQPPKTHSEKNQKRKTSESGREDAQKASSYELTALNPEVLALKTRIMQLSTSHEVRMDHDTILLHILTSSRA
jgi:nucleolar pre-ribosomal-associated protein 2